jgi:hypothetical protein
MTNEVQWRMGKAIILLWRWEHQVTWGYTSCVQKNCKFVLWFRVLVTCTCEHLQVSLVMGLNFEKPLCANRCGILFEDFFSLCWWSLLCWADDFNFCGFPFLSLHHFYETQSAVCDAQWKEMRENECHGLTDPFSCRWNSKTEYHIYDGNIKIP